MKTTIKMFIAAAFLFTTSLAKANDTNPKNLKMLSQEIGKIISSANWDEAKKFTITFMVTPQKEILVSGTSDESIDYQIKSLLNYKKLDVSGISPNEVFTLPVQIKL